MMLYYLETDVQRSFYMPKFTRIESVRIRVLNRGLHIEVS